MWNQVRFGRSGSGSVFAFLVVTSVLFAGSGPARYRIDDLGTFGGPDGCEYGQHPTWASGRGLNELGHVVGWAERSVHLTDPDTGEPLYYPDTGNAVCTISSHAALWRDGEIVDLGALEGQEYAQPNRINDHDQVVGRARVDRNSSGPFLWTEEGGMVNLLDGTSLSGDTSWGINNFGEITFFYQYGYFRDVNGEVRELRFPDSPADGWFEEAWEINDDGVVAGFAMAADGQRHAYRYDSRADAIEDVHDPFYRRSYGYAVNDQGDIGVEMVAYTGHSFQAVVTRDGRMAVLSLGNMREDGVLRPDLLLGRLDDLNAHGDLVGTDVSAAPLPPMSWVAFDVFGDGPIEKIPLEDLLSPQDREEWEIFWAWGINDNRQLAGRGSRNGNTRAFLMTPEDRAQDGEDPVAAAATVVGEGPVGVSQVGIDPVTGLEGVKNFVPEGMGPNRVVGSLRPRSMDLPRETGGVDDVEPASGPDGPLSRVTRRASGSMPRGTNPDPDREPFDRRRDTDDSRRQPEPEHDSDPTTRDDG